MPRHLTYIQGEGLGVPCNFCGAITRQGEKHTEECRDAWRKMILSYKS